MNASAGSRGEAWRRPAHAGRVLGRAYIVGRRYREVVQAVTVFDDRVVEILSPLHGPVLVEYSEGEVPDVESWASSLTFRDYLLISYEYAPEVWSDPECEPVHELVLEE